MNREPADLAERGACVILARKSGQWAIYKEQGTGRPPLILGQCPSRKIAVRVWIAVAAVEAAR
jgi:hypothetical protein